MPPARARSAPPSPPAAQRETVVARRTSFPPPSTKNAPALATAVASSTVHAVKVATEPASVTLQKPHAFAEQRENVHSVHASVEPPLSSNTPAWLPAEQSASAHLPRKSAAEKVRATKLGLKITAVMQVFSPAPMHLQAASQPDCCPASVIRRGHVGYICVVYHERRGR
eukprot:scaffold1849_cov66-Phaeocystis_antarctica.AAC.3